MKNDLLRFNFNQKYITFDAETESLNLLYSRPWQVAWVEAVGKKIVSRKELHIFWPDLRVSDEAARITGFDYDKYRSLAISPEEAWEEVAPILKDESNKIIGQNILGFDVYMLNSWHRAMGRGPLDFSFVNRILDTKAMAMAIAKGCKSVDEDDLICWQYRWLNYREKGIKTSQAHLLKMYDIPHDPALLHNALIDVEMTFNIFQKQIFQLEI